MDSPQYPATRKRNLVSHLVGVPIGEDLNAICVVLWQSRRTRNLITLGISSLRFPPGEYPAKIHSIESLIDTGANIIRSGYWHLGPEIFLDIPLEISLRTDVGKTWCNDEPLRPCSGDDYSLIPPLQLAGMGVVEEYIRYLDRGANGSKYCLKNQAAMKTHLINYPISMA